MELPRRPRREVLAAGGLFLLACVMRVTYVLSVHSHPAVRLRSLDSRAYHSRALEILAGDWMGDRVYYQDPLYPFLLAGFYSLFGADSWAVPVFQALLDSCTVLLIYGIARRVFDPQSGLVAGLIAAFYKVFFYYDALLLKVPLMLFLLTLALYLLVRGTSSQRGAPWLGAGLVLGLALLTRGNALLFLPVLLAWISFVWDAPERRRLRAMAFVALGVACVLLPITLRNYAVSGDWVLLNSQAGQNFYIGNFRGNDTGAFRSPPFLHPNPQFEEQDFLREAERASGRSMRPSEVSSYWLGRGLEEIVADPAHFARHSFRKVLVLANDFEVPDNYSFDFFREYVSPALGLPLPTYGSLLPLALCGIYFARNRLATLLFAFLIAYGSSLLIFFNLSRLRLPLVPVLIVFAAYGVVVLARRAAARRWLHICVSALFLAVSYSIVHLEVTPRDLTVRFFNLGVRHASVAKEHSSRAFALLAGGDPAHMRDAFSLAEEQERLAEELFRKGFAKKPGSRKLRLAMRNLHVTRISNLEARGQYARALDAALVLTREDPDFPGGFVRLARLHAKRGDEAGAIAALETALRLAPDDAIVRTQLERLRGRGTPTR